MMTSFPSSETIFAWFQEIHGSLMQSFAVFLFETIRAALQGLLRFAWFSTSWVANEACVMVWSRQESVAVRRYREIIIFRSRLVCANRCEGALEQPNEYTRLSTPRVRSRVPPRTLVRH